MEKELLNQAYEIDNLPKTGKNIKLRRRLINELGRKYLKNLSNLNFMDNEKKIIENVIKKYDGEFEEAIENSIKLYFDKLYINCNFNFINKNRGVQAGRIVRIIENNNNEHLYYVKTHQYGFTSESSTKQPLDIKELYIYKLLEKLNIGSEVHWFESDIFEDSIYIATKGLSNHELNIDREIIKLDIITRILVLTDVMSNKTNILQHDDKKGYIIDFRVSKNINIKDPYLYYKIYESFLNGNKTINYNYDKCFDKVMSPNNNNNKINYLKDIINNELNIFKNVAQNTYEDIKNDIIIKKYDNTDLLQYIENIKINYDNIKKF